MGKGCISPVAFTHLPECPESVNGKLTILKNPINKTLGLQDKKVIMKKRKTKVKVKLIKEQTILDLWSKAVKIKYSYKCAYCKRSDKEARLNSHHIFSRRHKATKYDLDNGICLCVDHHKFKPFSAHESPEFILWMIDFIGKEKYEDLKRRANSIKKYTEMEKREILNNLKGFIKENENE